MARTRIVLERDMDGGGDPHDASARGRALREAWAGRRQTAWRTTTEDLGPRAATHATRHRVTLAIINAGERPDGTRIEIMRMAVDVQTLSGEDAVAKAMAVLDMPRDEVAEHFDGTGPGTTAGRSLHGLEGRSVIGPMDQDWPSGRTITDYSSRLGGHGQAGTGFSGWQLNGGSWIVLPLADSASWITLTIEETVTSPDRTRLDIVVDQRIIGADPVHLDAFPPWEREHAGHGAVNDIPDLAAARPRITRFDGRDDGFVMEAVDAVRTWRFEISPHLPRPPRDGVANMRRLAPGESMATAWVTAHDRHLRI